MAVLARELPGLSTELCTSLADVLIAEGVNWGQTQGLADKL